jgi:DSF synthase
MGLPEIMFNLFPGMGAYHLLLHRLTPIKAQQFITSGPTYLAQDLYHMGLVDTRAETGQGVEAVQDYIRTTSRQLTARHGLRAVMRESDYLNYDHLRRAANI